MKKKGVMKVDGVSLKRIMKKDPALFDLIVFKMLADIDHYRKDF